MAFSFDTTLSILNNAANELARAARDLGDERPDSPLTDRLRGALEELSACVNELSAERDRVAAAGTSPEGEAVVLRDVPRDPATGAALPGRTLPEGVTAKTIEADKKAIEDANAEAAKKAAEATATAAAMPVKVVADDTSDTKKK